MENPQHPALAKQRQGRDNPSDTVSAEHQHPDQQSSAAKANVVDKTATGGNASAAPRITVKICGLTTAEDARCAQENGADYCGVIGFERSPRYVSPAAAAMLLEAIAHGKRVYVDVAPTLAKLEAAAALGFDKFQIHCEADTAVTLVEQWQSVAGKGNLWLAPRIAPDAPFPEHLLPFADAILIDTFQKNGAHGGSGQTGNWQAFRQWREHYRSTQFVLALSLIHI